MSLMTFQELFIDNSYIEWETDPTYFLDFSYENSNNLLGWIMGAPLLKDPDDGDYTLHSTSPCIDAGTPTYDWGTLEVEEFEGVFLQDIEDYSGLAPDMGAFEYTCSALGDMNNDGNWNILDVVILANCVLTEECHTLANGCAGDMNSDGNFNVLDIVVLANCVLAEDCGD